MLATRAIILFPSLGFKMSKVESTILFLHDQLNEVESLLEYQEEGIDVEACENQKEFILDILERLE